MSTTRARRAGQDSAGREWLPIGIPLAEAAAQLGLSIEATRKRAQRGSLSGYKFAGAWYVVLPGVQDGRDAAGRTLSTPVQDAGQPVSLDTGQDSGLDGVPARFRVTPAEIERAVERTGARYLADMETILARVGQVYEGQLAAQRETIAELRRRAEAAEAERDDLRAQLEAAQAAPAAPEAPTVVVVEADTPRGAAGWWERVKRAVRG